MLVIMVHKCCPDKIREGFIAIKSSREGKIADKRANKKKKTASMKIIIPVTLYLEKKPPSTF